MATPINTPVYSIHEDIRPENILLMKGPSGSRYDFTPKIADFGLYSRVRTAKARASGSMGLDHYGNQRFSKASNRTALASLIHADGGFQARLSVATIQPNGTKEAT
jgi:serine/threonine protein kinase